MRTPDVSTASIAPDDGRQRMMRITSSIGGRALVTALLEQTGQVAVGEEPDKSFLVDKR